MKSPYTRVLYGGDYNPNQWPHEIWKEDMRLFHQAGINSATVNVFSWAKLQPSEDVYDFSELDQIVELLSRENMDIVMATSTAAMPAWMVKRYPEVNRVQFDGSRRKFGQRHNFCPNSLVFRKYASRLVEKLSERYAGNPHIVCWHIGNEYNTGCYCENCEKAFRVWLKEKYGSLEAVNRAWNTEFWGHTFYDWDEIVAPNALSEGMGTEWSHKTAFAGISLDYDRFQSDSLLECYKMERDIIRRYDPDTPITTNLMGTYKGLDYFKWAKEMDIISWDNYPAYDTPWSETAMRHDLMRGLKDQPFMLMEQTPSQQNWQPYNSLKRPGQMRAQSLQTMAHGGDTIQFFQLRRSVGACEKFHGAVISHSGSSETRVFREVSQLGKELSGLSEILGAEYPAEVGIVFDWENYWALEYTSGPSVDLKYCDQIHQYYRYFYDRHIPVSMVHPEGDLQKYKAVIAPVLYMVKEGVAEALEKYVEQGGVLLTGFMSGIVDQSDNVHLGGYPGPLRKLCGVWAEEIDVLPPDQHNSLRMGESTFSCGLLCDILHLEGAEALASYGEDFYAGTPAVTRNRYGKGAVYYVGTQPDQAGLQSILDELTRGADIHPLIFGESGLEITRRVKDGREYWFLINLSGREQPLPREFAGETDLLTGRPVMEVFAPFDAVILRR